LDYLEVIKRLVPCHLIQHFNIVNEKKMYSKSIDYKTIYLKFKNIYKKKEKVNHRFHHIENSGDGSELIQIFNAWGDGLIPVVCDEMKLSNDNEIPLFWKKNELLYPLIFFTSGTKNQKKATVITLENIIYHYLGVKETLKLDANSIYALNLPTSHLSGLMPLFRSFFSGGSVEKFSLKNNRPSNITHLSLVNSQLQTLIKNHTKYPNLKNALVGGGKINPSLLQECNKQNLPIAITYGLSEMTSTVTIRDLVKNPLNKDELIKGFHLGAPLRFRELEIKKDRLICSGNTCYLGYFLNDKFIKSNGSFITSDLVEIKNGNLFFKSRIDEIFISGGKNVSLEAVRDLISKCPNISDFYLDLEDDEIWGQRYNLLHYPRKFTSNTNSNIFSWCNINLKNEFRPKKIITLHNKQITGIKPSKLELKNFSKSYKTIFLHGLFGTTEDWNFALEKIPFSKAVSLEVSKKALTFNDGIDEIMQKIKKVSNNKPVNLIGYSMGGRIGLHLLRRSPSIFNSLTMISSNYLGIKCPKERKRRENYDSKLLDNIKNDEDYKDFLKNWYRQNLFGNYSKSEDFNNKLNQASFKQVETYKKMLSIFSPGKQTYLEASQLEKLSSHTINYIYGENDIKYKEIAENSPSYIQNYELQDSAHVCHLEQKQKFLKIVKMMIC
jgi:2-succinyl-6-hydroxy-2,4-cyclohexadiene-1-carboxylate synthase